MSNKNIQCLSNHFYILFVVGKDETIIDFFCTIKGIPIGQVKRHILLWKSLKNLLRLDGDDNHDD